MATAVNKLSATQYEVVFPNQTAPGTYTLVIGPQITDLAGVLVFSARQMLIPATRVNEQVSAEERLTRQSDPAEHQHAHHSPHQRGLDALLEPGDEHDVVVAFDDAGHGQHERHRELGGQRSERADQESGEGGAADELGSNPGTVTGGLRFTNGVAGEAFQFNGTNASVVIPGSASLTVRSLTFDAWIYLTDLSQPRPILEYAPTTGRAGMHFWLNAMRQIRLHRSFSLLPIGGVVRIP